MNGSLLSLSHESEPPKKTFANLQIIALLRSLSAEPVANNFGAKTETTAAAESERFLCWLEFSLILD